MCPNKVAATAEFRLFPSKAYCCLRLIYDGKQNPSGKQCRLAISLEVK